MRRLAVFAFPFTAAASVFVYTTPVAAAICAAAGVAVFILLSLFRPKLRSAVIISCAGIATGIIWCAILAGVVFAPMKGMDGTDKRIEATVISYPVQRTYGEHIEISTRVENSTVKARLYIAENNMDLRPGDEISVRAAFSYSDGRLYAAADGNVEITGYKNSVKYLPATMAKLMSDSIARVFSAETAPFTQAITVGDTSALYDGDERLNNALSRSGIAHIVSVSGMHVQFLIAFVAIMIKNKKVLAFAVAPILLLFCAVVGFSVTVTRAVIMQSLVIAAPLLRRKQDGVTSLAAALFVLVAFNPYSVKSIGMQLSFLSTFGIIALNVRMTEPVYSALAKSGLNKHVKRIIKFAATCLAVSTAALIPTTPLLAYYFGYISIIAPLTNIATLWASSFAFCGGLIAGIAGIFSPYAGRAAAIVSELPVLWVINCAKLFSSIPFAVVYVSNPYILIWLAHLYAAFSAVFVFGIRLRAVVFTACGSVLLLLTVLMLSAVSPHGGDLSVTVLDVGQGQSIVLTDSGAAAVIDCGSLNKNAASQAEEYLQANGIVSIDLLLITHFHEDHANGVPELLERFNVQVLITPIPELGGTTRLSDEIISLANEKKTSIIYVTEPMMFTLGGAGVTVLPPIFDIPGDENASCISILATVGGWDVLVTGDMDYFGEIALTELYVLPDVELFIAGHHGSRLSTSSEILDTVKPETVVISVGTNTFGHPSETMLSRLEARGISVYRTDENGNITVRSSKNAS